jgi:excisionase family DNA binding protein
LVVAVSVEVVLTLSDEQIELIARRAAELLPTTSSTPSSPWLDADGAAAYLATKRDRIYDLIQLGKLQPRRDGRRVVLRRDDLDAYLEASS